MKNLFLKEAEEIAATWSQCDPDDDILRTSDNNRKREALKIRAQILVNESSDPVLLREFFKKTGIETEPYISGSKMFGFCGLVSMLFVLMLAVVVLCFSRHFGLDRGRIVECTAVAILCMGVICIVGTLMLMQNETEKQKPKTWW